MRHQQASPLVGKSNPVPRPPGLVLSVGVTLNCHPDSLDLSEKIVSVRNCLH